VLFVTRFCKSCQRQRPLRDFDLGADAAHVACLACEHEPASADVSRERSERRARQSRQEQIAELEDRRRGLIASLVRVDAEIAALRAVRVARSSPPSDFEDDDEDDVFS